MNKKWFTHDNTTSLLIWLRIGRFYQRSNQLSNGYLDQFGLTINQFDTMVQIAAHQPLTQMELAEQLMISRGGISHMLKRLEKEGLIARKQEWKIKYISLTEKGQAIIDKVLPLQSDFQASMVNDALDEKEQKHLLRLLKKVHRHSLEMSVPNVSSKKETENE
ncbi:MarR family winged helix-turn-helix transcriptional regulator [Bacillus sp. 1P06AnD]|uniref:MarR family winged helix-turn-helix transcriptional regulator n=1 Tax=Bacillus sp. 1P06AnD TaxID=3132208 RepID=UPI0039A040F6